jgi:hypothetical protein
MFTQSINIAEADEALFGQLATASQNIPSSDIALAIKSDGVIGIGKKIQVTTVGVSFDGINESEWKTFFTLVSQIKRSLQWMIGDWVTYGRDALDWSYDDIAEYTGYKANAIKQYAYVARNVSASIRIDALTFGHHQVLAHLPQSLQSEWLDKAAKNRWSIRVLREAVADTPALPEKDPLGIQYNKRRMNRITRTIELVGNGIEITPDRAQKIIVDLKALREWLNTIERQLNSST